ncbi:MAG TPA: hypothetical protein VMM58_04935 [Bacteroidota bacterium]|nr:hypothetical protein [Bacteroidota bacterium]
MGWKQEQRERILDKAATVTEARIRKRNKSLVKMIIATAILGTAVILIDNATRSKGALLPIDFTNQPSTVSTWKRMGFIKSIVDTSSSVVVDETLWENMSHGERQAVVMLLASYCATENHRSDYRLTINGHLSHTVLASVDDKRVVVK